ncbi:MAG: peptidoglycan DD-metalloendopeptidase family protein [Azospirillaceae bacterium]
MTGRAARYRTRAGLLAAGLLLVPIAAAQDDPQATRQAGDEALAEIENAITFTQDQRQALADRQAEVGAELQALRLEALSASDAVLRLEERIVAIGEDIRALELRAGQQELALRTGQERMSRLAAGLQRMARLPVPILAASETLSDEVIRGALLLNHVLEPLQAEASAIRARISSLAETLDALDRQRDALDTAIAEQQAEVTRLEQAMAARQALLAALRSDATAESERATALAETAEDIRRLVRGLDEESDIAELESELTEVRLSVAAVTRLSTPAAGDLAPPPDIAMANGVLLPAVGEIAVPFGGIDRFGRRAQGLTLAVRPGQPVIAPADGVVRYAGPFRGFGMIAVIDHGDGLYSTITDLGRADVIAGQAVLAGEPIAVTLPQNEDSQESRLYFEVRRDGEPMNPLTALAGR